jgi:DNA-binding CsgD family transcriptional regulator
MGKEGRVDRTNPQKTAPTKVMSLSKDSFFSFSDLREHAGLWLGMATFLGWLNCFLCFEGVLRDEVEEAGGLIHDPVFLAITLTASALLLLFSLLSEAKPILWLRPLIHRTPFLVTIAGFGAICSITSILCLNFAIAVPVAFSYALGIGIGVIVCTLTIEWGSLLASYDLRTVLLVVCLAFCLQWAPFLVLGLLKSTGHIILASLLLATSVICLIRSSDSECPASQVTSVKPNRENTLPKIGWAMFCFAFLIQFIWTFFIAMTPAHLNVDSFIWVFLAVIAATILLVVLMLSSMEKQRSYRINIIYRTAFFFCICAACVLGIADEHLLVSYIVVYIAYSFVIPTMWMLALGFVFISKTPSIKAFGLVFGVQYLGFFCGFLFAKTLETVLGRGSGTLIAPYATLIMVMLLALVYVAILPEHSLLTLSPRMFGISHETVDQRCTELGAQYRLSKRELEIFTLFARGRSTKYIEKTLYISKNTVATHRKNIYRKLEVHSQQELLSLIEGTLT